MERVGSGPDASAEGHGPDDTDQGSNPNRGDQEKTAIVRLSSADEPLEESVRSSTGSGVPSVVRNVSVNTGLRNMKVSEGDAPGKGARNPAKARASHPGTGVVDVRSDLLFDSPMPEDDLDLGGKVDAEGDQDTDDDSARDEGGAGRQLTSSGIKERAATEIRRDKNRQRKYHTKKSAQRSKGGRAKGSKAKSSVTQQVASAGWF